jgi:hypothetical protein
MSGRTGAIAAAAAGRLRTVGIAVATAATPAAWRTERLLKVDDIVAPTAW